MTHEQREKEPDGWISRRRARRRLEGERTGDSPEKRAEPPGDEATSVDEAAKRASGNLLANGASFTG